MERFTRAMTLAALCLGVVVESAHAGIDRHAISRASVVTGTLPRPDHIVIVVEENRSFTQIMKSKTAPYIQVLAAQGANFVDAHGIQHPSQPNYIGLLSGSTQGIRNDSCPHDFDVPNLGSQLIAAGLSFGGYAESLPSVGSTVCVAPGSYARRHNPIVDFINLPQAVNMPFTNLPTDFTQLPTVSIVVPNLRNDMHSGPTSRADAWLRTNLDPYIQWAKTHNSLFILTWDEGGDRNHIPTIFVGPMVKQGQYSERIDQYDILGTVESMLGLPPLGIAAERQPISDVWVGP